MTSADAWLRRLERDAVIVAGVMAAVALAVWPGHPGRAAGVLGGFALAAVSYLGIRAGVAEIWPAGEVQPSASADAESVVNFRATAAADGAVSAPEPLRPQASRGFVKFFTRHAILALGAYVMMARFEFDPMAMLVGVTSPAVAASVEIVRTIRARQGGPQSR